MIIVCAFSSPIFFSWKTTDDDYLYRRAIKESNMLFEGEDSLHKPISILLSTRTATDKLRTTPRAMITLESAILICDIIVPTTLTFWLIVFFKACRLSACIALSYYVSRQYYWISFVPSPVSNTLFRGYILLSMRPVEIKNL